MGIKSKVKIAASVILGAAALAAKYGIKKIRSNKPLMKKVRAEAARVENVLKAEVKKAAIKGKTLAKKAVSKAKKLRRR